MAVSIVAGSLERSSSGDKRRVRGQLVWTTYTTGGDILLNSILGLIRIQNFEVKGAEAGFSFNPEINAARSQVNIFVRQGSGSTPAGTNSVPAFTGTADVQPLIVEEVQAVASDTGTLTNVPGYIIAVEVTAGGTTGAFSVIPTGETPLTTQCAVTFPTGVMTFAAADAVTSVRVTYLPVRAGTMIVAANFAIDATVVAAAAGVNLAARAAMVQYVYDTTGGTVLTPIPVGEAPGAGEYALDIDNGGNTTITTNAGIDGNSLKVTSFAFTNLPSPDMHIGDADITLNSEAYGWNADGNFDSLIIPAHGVHLVGEDGAAANKNTHWVGPSGTAAAGVARFRPSVNDVLTNETVAMVTMAIPFVILPLWALADHTPFGTVAAPVFTGTPLAAAAGAEVANGVDLAAAGLTVVDFEAWGV